LCGHGCRQVVKISPRTMESFFNRCLQQLARFNVFPKYIRAACDATDIETTKQFKGSGAVTGERKVEALNRNKLIVFVGPSFGIFSSHEVFMLAGVPVHDAEKELKITRAQIYTQYTGLKPPDSS
jgi:hypothetical protein